MLASVCIGNAVRLAVVVAIACASAPAPREFRVETEADLRVAARAHSAIILLPAHPILLHRGIVLQPSGTITIQGTAGSELIAASPLERAVIEAAHPRALTLRNFSIEGGRDAGRLAPEPLPPSEVAFIDFYRRNGIEIAGGEDVRIENLHLRHIADFGIIVSGSHGVKIRGVSIADSGSL